MKWLTKFPKGIHTSVTLAFLHSNQYLSPPGSLWTVPMSFTLKCHVHAKSLQLCPTICDPMDCSPPGSSVHGILQARILEWVANAFSRKSSQPSDQTSVSYVSCTGSEILYHYCYLGSPSKWCISIIFSIINSLTQGEKSFLLWVNSSELGETTCIAVSIKYFFKDFFDVDHF